MGDEYSNVLYMFDLEKHVWAEYHTQVLLPRIDVVFIARYHEQQMSLVTVLGYAHGSYVSDMHEWYEENGEWEWVPQYPKETLGRTAPAYAYDRTTDSLYVHGGYATLKSCDMQYFCFANNTWHTITWCPYDMPSATRYSHAMVAVGYEKLFLLGGAGRKMGEYNYYEFNLRTQQVYGYALPLPGIVQDFGIAVDDLAATIYVHQHFKMFKIGVQLHDPPVGLLVKMHEWCHNENMTFPFCDVLIMQ